MINKNIKVRLVRIFKLVKRNRIITIMGIISFVLTLWGTVNAITVKEFRIANKRLENINYEQTKEIKHLKNRLDEILNKTIKIENNLQVDSNLIIKIENELKLDQLFNACKSLEDLYAKYDKYTLYNNEDIRNIHNILGVKIYNYFCYIKSFKNEYSYILFSDMNKVFFLLYKQNEGSAGFLDFLIFDIYNIEKLENIFFEKDITFTESPYLDSNGDIRIIKNEDLYTLKYNSERINVEEIQTIPLAINSSNEKTIILPKVYDHNIKYVYLNEHKLELLNCDKKYETNFKKYNDYIVLLHRELDNAS